MLKNLPTFMMPRSEVGLRLLETAIIAVGLFALNVTLNFADGFVKIQSTVDDVNPKTN